MLSHCNTNNSITLKVFPKEEECGNISEENKAFFMNNIARSQNDITKGKDQ